jgi:RimJ/RimL family protein N-acetyltransferase
MFPEITRDDVFLLETRRLWLRWPRPSDAPAIAALAGEWDVARMTANVPHPYAPGDADRFVESARAANARGVALCLALTLKSFPRKLVGVIGVDPGEFGAELGFWLGRPYWGRCLMSEAAQALIDAFFRVTNGQALSAQVAVENAASRAVLEKTGFVEVERLDAGLGRHSDGPVARMELRRRNWQAPRGVRWQRAFATDAALT